MTVAQRFIAGNTMNLRIQSVKRTAEPARFLNNRLRSFIRSSAHVLRSLFGVVPPAHAGPDRPRVVGPDHVWIEGLRGNQQTAIERAKLLTFIRKSTITFRTTLHTQDLSAIEYQR